MNKLNIYTFSFPNKDKITLGGYDIENKQIFDKNKLHIHSMDGSNEAGGSGTPPAQPQTPKRSRSPSP